MKSKGISFIELMIILAIVGIVAAIAVPNIIHYKDKKHAAADNTRSECVVITVGDHTYIEFKEPIPGDANENARKILQILDDFKTSHQDLEVMSWKIQDIKYGYATAARIFGIWVDHKPKSYGSSN